MRAYIVYMAWIVLFFELQSTAYQAHLKEWYPFEKATLSKTIENHFNNAAQKYHASISADSIKIAIVPHAGYAYSGDVAAGVYRLLKGKKVSNIIVLFPAHHKKFDGVAVTDKSTYSIPLGSVALDYTHAHYVAHKNFFQIDNDVFESEHSFEIQLPFLYTLFPKATVFPLCVGNITKESAHSIACDLRALIDENTLIIVSSDFVHYGEKFAFSPFASEQALHVRALNRQAIETIVEKKYDAFEAYVKEKEPTICGIESLKLMLSLCDDSFACAVPEYKKLESRLIAYATSDPKHDSFVSYIGIVFTTEKLENKSFEEQFTKQEIYELHKQLNILGKKLLAPDFNDSLYYPIIADSLKKTRGLFVTIEKLNPKTKKYELRGCIGHTTSDAPLYKEVSVVLRKAAFEDSRFSPITAEEIPHLRFSLSILSSFTPIYKPERRLRIGVDGLLFESPQGSALFLPEVALEHKWDKRALLENISKKAGLEKDEWKSMRARFKTFQTIKVE